MIRNPILRFLPLMIAGLGLSNCAPKIYVIDRQTVLEDEAAGEWPQFEKALVRATPEKTPSPAAQVEPSEPRRRLFNVLNGPMIGEAESPPPPPRTQEKSQ